MSNCRIQVRIGQHEFSAEGPEELIKQQYADFLRLVGNQTPSAAVTQPPNLWWVFETGKEGSLRVMMTRVPGGNRTDFMILYLYGKLACYGQEEVSATELIKVIKGRGLLGTEERVDRLLSPYSGHVIKTGAKRGSAYKLTPSGIDYAEILIGKANIQHEAKK